MTCAQALELVEPIAAGELDVDPAVRAHIETCPGCASALATARRIEATLAARVVPAAPERFEASVLQRIRRERWHSEVQVDRLFNVAVALALVLITGGVMALLNLEGLVTGVAGMWAVLSATSTGAMRSALPTVSTYIAAAGLLLSALAMWWWADRALGY